jgi:uncharacterized membrane protein YdbT with pleckstrin-like domain
MPGEEKDLLTIRPAWKSYFVFYAAIVIFGFGPVLNPDVGLKPSLGRAVALLLVFFVIYRKKTTKYRVTSARVIRETGGLGLGINKDLPLEEIASISVRRGITHRLLGIGHLQFQARSSNQLDLWWFGITNPFQVVRDIERLISKG